MCALMALLLFHWHSPVSYVLCSKCTTLILMVSFYPLAPFQSAALLCPLPSAILH